METKTLTLTDFLLARIAEEQDVAERAMLCRITVESDRPGDRAPLPAFVSEYLRLIKPARVLAECEAKRQIVNYLLSGYSEAYGAVLAALALPYADHPDYPQGWFPEHDA